MREAFDEAPPSLRGDAGRRAEQIDARALGQDGKQRRNEVRSIQILGKSAPLENAHGDLQPDAVVDDAELFERLAIGLVPKRDLGRMRVAKGDSQRIGRRRERSQHPQREIATRHPLHIQGSDGGKVGARLF